jgi:ParB family chromosome partitioning protein
VHPFNVSASRRRLNRTLNDAFAGGPARTELGGASALFDHAPGTGHLRRIPVDRIRPRTERPRRSLDPDALDELAASIRTHGVLQPIRVRSCGGGRYEIVAGERRWIAARQAGLREIPALITASDDQHAYVESLVENIQREDLNAVDRAHALRHLRVNLGLQTWEDVGRIVGITRQHVHNLLRVTQLPEHVQDAVRAGDLTEKHARALLLLRADPESQGELWEQISDEELSGDAALDAAQRMRVGESAVSRREVRSSPALDTSADHAASYLDDDEDDAAVIRTGGTAIAPMGSRRVVNAVDALLDVLADATPHELLVARSRLEALQGRLASVLTAPPASRERVAPEGWPMLIPVAGKPAS